ncbi:hypothetical protein ACQP1G_16670 [Nocardia sp. CA-107356]
MVSLQHVAAVVLVMSVLVTSAGAAAADLTPSPPPNTYGFNT